MKTQNDDAVREADELRKHYNFDYSRAKPNRFSDQFSEEAIAVVLDRDVAAVFTTSEAANQALRTLITEDALYSLEFLFEIAESSVDELRNSATRILEKHLSDVVLEIEPMDPQSAQLSIKGSLEDVDACHDKLNKELVERRSCVRLRDEAGDEIRERAFPILARIEQSLRSFVNRAMVEVKGFDWWEPWAPTSIQPRVTEIEKRSGRRAEIYHPVELTTFEHLVAIISGSVQKWREDRPLTASDLREILSECPSINELRARLEAKTQEVSLWDTVFGRYFEEIDQWEELKDSILGFTIEARNKVMHHRPMRLYELRKLVETEDMLQALLESSRPKLSDEQREAASTVVEEVLGSQLKEQQRATAMYDQLSPQIVEAAARAAAMYDQLSPQIVEAAARAAAMYDQISPQMVEAAIRAAAMYDQVSPQIVQAAARAAAMYDQISPQMVEAATRAAAMYDQVSPQMVEAAARAATMAERISPKPSQQVEKTSPEQDQESSDTSDVSDLRP